jgi:uncharacterized membrane protein YqhA
MFMRIFSQTRYIVLLPVLGLFLASAFLFITGGFGLLMFLFDSLYRHGLAPYPEPKNTVTIMEFVEQFLTGTVLYIIAVGLYGLFIRQLNVPEWLRIESLDEMKHTVIGVVVAVLAVKFMGVIVEWDEPSRPLEIGAAIGLVTAGLGIYMGLRHRGPHHEHHQKPPAAIGPSVDLVREGEDRSL